MYVFHTITSDAPYLCIEPHSSKSAVRHSMFLSDFQSCVRIDTGPISVQMHEKVPMFLDLLCGTQICWDVNGSQIEDSDSCLMSSTVPSFTGANCKAYNKSLADLRRL